MIATILIVSLAFYWLLRETDYFRIHLIRGAIPVKAKAYAAYKAYSTLSRKKTYEVPIYTGDKLMYNAKGSRMNAYNSFRKELFYDNILSGANISLMVNGHTHQHLWAEKVDGLNFPVLINSNQNGMMMSADENAINISVFDEAGKAVRPDIRIARK